ncbi:MAG: hypothetical protein RIR97_1358, partial [Pseudomonadota bacterium]
MIIVNRFGRVASAAIISSGLFFATVGQAADVTDEQIKIARGALDALGATTNFDNILPTIA